MPIWRGHSAASARRGRQIAKAAPSSTALVASTVRQIVEQHGGTIEATSAFEEGATFTICLPRLADAAECPRQIGSQAA